MTIPKTMIASIGLFLATSLTSVTSLSQPDCQPRSYILSFLAIGYDEHPLLTGNDEGDIVELFSSQNGETFTVIVSKRVGNQICTRIVAEGKNLRPMPFSPGHPS